MTTDGKTFILLAGLMAAFLVFGQLAGGTQGMITALLIGGALNFVMYFFSDKMVLKMYGAKVVTRADAPELYDMVDRLRQRAGLPMPVVAIANQEQPNAFATGRSPEKAVVAVTAGLLAHMPAEEIEGVIAHELAHIKNRDMLLSTVAAGLAGAIGFLPRFLFLSRDDDGDSHPMIGLALMILAPIAAMIVQFALSRRREFEADRVGAEILGRPQPLASALQRLDVLAQRIPMNVVPAAAPLAQVNPLAAHGGGVASLFSTHPPTAARVNALLGLSAGR
ncbi:MAG: zinc metalloprotease HtpX [Gemmatimonadales bacterium]|nr:zinc metalloprotease HtpX [Gemmatimonadales bacterium]